MPICINNPNKYFKGNEKSPLGLGYSAASETNNKIMKGNDNNYYIVKNNRWYKINNYKKLFQTIPDDCYNYAYKPKVKKIETETGKEEKFGGRYPFFVKGEVWPSKEEYHMTFFCQFKDPSNPSSNYLYRVFLMIDDDGIIDNYWINKIELNENNLNNQILLEKPEYSEEIKKNEYFNEEKFEPYQIISWTKFKEMKLFEEIRKYFSVSEYIYGQDNELYNKLEKAYYKLHSPSPGIKVRGTPLSTQDQEQVQDYNLLQIEFEYFMPYMFGDAGIGHVSDECEFTWDCC